MLWSFPMERLVFLITFSSLLSNTQQAPSYLITAPNVVHLGTHETITVQVHGAQHPLQVTAYFKDETKNKVLSEKTVFNLNQNNNYQEMKALMVKPQHQDLFKKGEQPYVLLVTESRDLYEETVQSIRIPLSSKKGYIFIQTDKPIYTPSSKVRYRIFILDNSMRPADETVTIAVLNSKGLVVKKSDRKIKTVFSENFEIPDIAEPGTWKIKAWFHHYGMSNVSAEFEVKNYASGCNRIVETTTSSANTNIQEQNFLAIPTVANIWLSRPKLQSDTADAEDLLYTLNPPQELPSFEVKLIPLQPYYHIWNENFVFDIEAKHFYGKGIQGAAYVRFGIIDDSEKKVFLPGLEQQISIQNGKGRVTLNTTLLEEKLKKSIFTLEGFHLYVAVTTVETASGEMREEELSNVKFVKSPYAVDLSNTKKYFVPGAPFTVVASVTLTDGSPAAFIAVTAMVTLPGKPPMKKTALSNKKGLIPFTFDIPGDAENLQIVVKAREGKEKLESPETSIRAERYQSASPSYLSISIPHTVVAPGDTLSITLNDIHQSGSGKIDYFYYMVVTRGQTELLGRVPSSNKIINLRITHRMVPAFRFLAYYFIANEGREEIVADSAWVDVMDVCEGKIKVRTEQEVYEPTENINLMIETDHAGTVALAVVDKAVSILNKKNKLTDKKVFSAMNSYDLGCSAGGGADNVQVFTDVGLAFLSNTVKSNIQEASKYLNTDLQKCCEDGMKLNPMRFSCLKRLTKVASSSECRKAFQECCEKATALRKKAKRIRVGLARYYDDHEEWFDESSVTLRSYFPESWWWNLEEVENPGNHSVGNVVPDSITTWEVQAISISPQKGFCVAEPHTFAVFKDFFVSMRLPFSVKRHEQLEIKVVIYNYKPLALKVRVKMYAAEGLCTAEVKEKAVQLELMAERNSATAAYFSVVPLTVGEIPITITAFDTISGDSDSIRKSLNVVAEGVLQREEKTICINSDLKSHTLDLSRPSDMVPGSDSHVFVSLQGNIMDDPVENCLSLTGVEKLIKVPTGCAEQTMVKMAPTVYAFEYLDASKQWEDLKPEQKEEAIQMIEKGYTRLLEFQKVDGSYGAFKSIPSSVWLTAFIVKVLIRCREYISIQDSHIQNSVSYLIKQQQEDDSFHDHHPVLDRTMQGGIRSAEEDLALTAFVTIALQKALQVYNSPDVVQVISKAVGYMRNQLPRSANCYSTAITAYALTLVKSDSEGARFAKEKLRGCSVFDAGTEKQQRYWGNGNDAVSVETTAYALLQTLLLEDMEYARPIATWLTERRNYGGGYCSTQDTVVALEALSAYSIQTLSTASTNLTVNLGTPGRQKDYSITLTDAEDTIHKKLEFELGRKLQVSVHGRGNGTMSVSCKPEIWSPIGLFKTVFGNTVLKVYWSSELKNNSCNDLILTVEVEGRVKYDEPEYSYESYDYSEDSVAAENSMFEPLSQIEWFDIHSRRKRDVVSPSKAGPLQYKVCVRSTGSNAPKMSLVDLTLLSGLEPDRKDLEQLVMSSDQYIQHYEYKKGRVLLYFGEITTGPDPDCISFGAEQINPMGLVQPANAILYDFYNPDRKCSVFYSAPEHSTMLSKVCNAKVCQCAEGPCPRQRSTFSKSLTPNTRVSFVCYDPIVDYVYEVEILSSTQKNVFDYYEAKIHRILKATADESIQVGAHRQFLKRSACRLKVVPGKRYLLMGKDGKLVDCNNQMQYFLDAQTWIEKIPGDSECRTTLHRQACADLQDFMSKDDNLCLF